ncbi:hypothetical protein [Endozoicomonas ascidiicola]|uniref:hypothetical protein n=1 Tax=Endozoicomonas ascidiicola TaxID=1698521 RepID=UPI00082AFCEB|nr:hypothetical protein [Endozoicomonas ascidiicola]
MKSDCCAFCGSHNLELKPYYALPIHLGGSDDENNTIFICPIHFSILSEVRNTNKEKHVPEFFELDARLTKVNNHILILEEKLKSMSDKYEKILSDFEDFVKCESIMDGSLHNSECLNESTKDSNEIVYGAIDRNNDHVEFSTSLRKQLDKDIVNLTFNTFGRDVLLTSQALGCSIEDIKLFIDIESYEDSLQNESDAIATDDSFISTFITPARSKEVVVELNKVNKLQSYKVVNLKDYSILGKALENGVLFNSKGDPIIVQVGDARLKEAMIRNGWDHLLFRNNDEIKLLLDEGVAKLQENITPFKISSLTGLSINCVYDSIRRKKSQEKDEQATYSVRNPISIDVEPITKSSSLKAQRFNQPFKLSSSSILSTKWK